VSAWFEDVEVVTRGRKSLQEVMSLPIRMGEIRQMVEAAGAGDDRKMVRLVRAALDRQFRDRIIDLIGEIPAHPQEPAGDMLLRAAQASRELRPEMNKLAHALVARFVSERTPEKESVATA
jgi:hypothetical protein